MSIEDPEATVTGSGRRRRAVIVAAAVLLALAVSEPAVAAPSAALDVVFAPGFPAPPVLNQQYRYALEVGNNGDVPLDNLVVIDTLPVEMRVSDVTTGAYTGLTDFAAGEGVRVGYEKNTAPGVFTLWGSSPNSTTNTVLTAPPPGLGAGESSRVSAGSSGRRPRAWRQARGLAWRGR